MFKPNNIASTVLCVTAFPAALLCSPVASAGGEAPWLKQVGINGTLESAANWGKGQLIITVDTGIQLSNAEFAPGQVSRSLSSCVATSFVCSSGVNDDNSHGTAVASIAAANTPLLGTVNYGGYVTPAGSYIGVAPDANIAAEKALNAQGMGNSNDVANGIIKAANSGATVINLSLTYIPTASIVSAINYAASKGVFIVWAGGNSSAALNYGVNTSGLTGTAITHLIFAGSVSPTNKLSYFSNTPGSGLLINTTGNATAYDARWIMAPGENIIAPDVTAGPGWFAAWSGTSMSAPVVSGSLALLESAWPILKTNGTAENLLLATATHLGSNATNTTYGVGLLNMTTAFQPYGGLSIVQANGKTVALGNMSASLITGGALGSLPAVRAKLANYTALDSYSRNFSVNLSTLIQTKPTAATLNPLPVNANTGVKKIALADGDEMGLQIIDTPTDQRGGLYFGDSAQGVQRSLLVMLSDKSGTTTAFGYGNVMPSSYAYARALYDSDTAALAAENLATDLAALSTGGAQFAYGAKLGENSRFAVSFSNTAMQSQQPNQAQTSLANPIQPVWMDPSANTISMGFTQKLNDKLQLGISVRELNEKNGLLGAAYDASSATSFGSSNRTNEFGVSALYKLSDNSGLYFEAAQANTQNSGGGGMFAGLNGLSSQSWGVSFVSKAMLNNADHFVFNIKQPLRVNAGTAQMAVTNIDPITGVPSLGYQTVSMAPDGRETDMLATYDTPLSGTQNLSMELGYAKDVMNVAGSNNATVGFNWSMKF